MLLITELAQEIWDNIDYLIESANNNSDCKGYGIICSALNIPNDINPDTEENIFWEDMEEIEMEGEKFVSFAVSDYNDLVIYTSEYNEETY